MKSQSIMWRASVYLLLVVCVLLTSAIASAQRPLQQVLDLNRQAMDHYMNLEIPEAQDKLERALRAAQRGGITGAPMARTYMNMAVVAIGGMQDNAAGLEHFASALRTDPSVQLDPLTSTPDIQTVFNLARQRVGTGSQRRHQPSSSGDELPHTPVPEQLTQTAIPVYVEIPGNLDAQEVYLYYKGLGMRDYRRVRMRSLAGGYGYEIPCADVFEPTMEYYVVAMDDGDVPLAFAATAEDPIQIPIVSSRTHPPPALPGGAPPERCTDTECPPGMPGCSDDAGGGLGDTCVSNVDCRETLFCDDNFCVSEDEEEDEEAANSDDVPSFFVRLGGTLGFAWVTSGMPSDGAPPGGMGSNVYIPEGTENCADFDGVSGTDWCVRIQNPGFVPTAALRLTGGYYITDRIAGALTIRFQPSSGEGAMANLLIGVRGQYLLTRPVVTGLGIAVFAGTSYGQIQPQPPQPNEPIEPFIRSGLNGIQAGGTATYRIMKNFGLHVTPEVHIMLPLFLLNVDVTLGAEVAF